MTDDTYDRLVEFKDDPEAFQAETKRIIDEAIESFPEERRERMRAIQWGVDQELAKYKDPVARYNRIVAMMYESLGDLNRALKGELQQTEKAPVLDFKKPNT